MFDVKEKEITQKPLSYHVEKSIVQYFDDMEGMAPENLYDKFISQVERPMLDVVMRKVNNNQSEAAKLLGINRNTLRKKLQRYGMI